MRTYLDFNATAPLRPQARAATVAALDVVGNASSVHHEGRAARKIVEDAREQVAALVGASPDNVVFTSGATEANNWALSADWSTIFLPTIEHDSVLAAGRAGRGHVVEIGSDATGVIDLAALADGVLSGQHDQTRALVALQMANNETGVVQPVADVAQFCREQGLSLHTDAVQAAGRVAINFDDLGTDSLSVSSHKIGGPTGVGALVLREGCYLPPLILGGGQERRRRSGTENVIGIAGFGAAAQAAAEDISTASRLTAMRDRIELEVTSFSPAAQVIAADSTRLPNTTLVAVPGFTAETLLIKLDLAGVAVSSGSACSSGKVGASHVLAAMGIAPEVARGAIRVSLGWSTSDADVDAFLNVWREVVGARGRAVA